MKSIRVPDDVYQRAPQLAEADHVSVDRQVAALGERGCRRLGKGTGSTLNEARW